MASETLSAILLLAFAGTILAGGGGGYGGGYGGGFGGGFYGGGFGGFGGIGYPGFGIGFPFFPFINPFIGLSFEGSGSKYGDLTYYNGDYDGYVPTSYSNDYAKGNGGSSYGRRRR